MSTTRLPTPTRWTDAAWQSEVLHWADEALAAQGITRTGWHHHHIRAWSTVLRLDTTAGTVWLKAPGDGARHEVALLSFLDQLDAPHVPHPLAVDVERAWMLLPDDGEVSRVAYGGATPPLVMAEHLAVYGALQRQLEPYVDAFVALGVDDLRPERMAARFEATIDVLADERPPGRLSTDEVARLRSVLPAYADACAELAAGGIVPTLQHDDLHDANILATGPVFIDWGDACVGHPFGTMLATLNSIAYHHRLDPDDAVLAVVVDAYTEAWTGVHDRPTLRRLVALAQRVGPLTRSLSYRQALTDVDEAAWQEHAEAMPGWLLEVFEPDLPMRPPLLAASDASPSGDAVS